MANNRRKPLTYNVSEETYNRVRALFPNTQAQDRADCNEGNLLAMLEAYEHPQESSADLLQRVHQMETEREQLLQQIAELTNSVNTAEQAAGDTDKKLKGLQDTNTYLQNQHALLQGENTELREQAATLQQQVQALQDKKVTWEQIRTTMLPFTVALLEETAARLTERYGKEVRPVQILTDMFLRYSLERWNEWFYKFCLTDKDILAIAQSVNPEITDIKQVRKAVLGK